MALNCSEQLYGCSWINIDKQFSPLNCRNSIRSMKLKQPRTRGHVIDIHRPNQPTNLNPTEQTENRLPSKRERQEDSSASKKCLLTPVRCSIQLYVNILV